MVLYGTVPPVQDSEIPIESLSFPNLSEDTLCVAIDLPTCWAGRSTPSTKQWISEDTWGVPVWKITLW